MREIEAKTILSAYTKDDSWFGANYHMNILRGAVTVVYIVTPEAIATE